MWRMYLMTALSHLPTLLKSSTGKRLADLLLDAIENYAEEIREESPLRASILIRVTGRVRIEMDIPDNDALTEGAMGASEGSFEQDLEDLANS